MQYSNHWIFTLIFPLRVKRFKSNQKKLFGFLLASYCYDSGIIRNPTSSHILVIPGNFPAQAIISDFGKIVAIGRKKRQGRGWPPLVKIVNFLQETTSVCRLSFSKEEGVEP